MAYQPKTIEQIRDVPPWSILAMLTGEADDFTGIEAIKRWITRRYDKLIIPFMVMGIFLALAVNNIFTAPTFLFGWSIGQIFTGLFIMSLVLVFVMLLFSSFILTMKAGKGKGNMKFNLRDRNAERLNEIEIDVIIKNIVRINRNTKRFEIFKDMLTDKGDLILPDSDTTGKTTVSTSFDSLSGDPLIAEIQAEVKDWKINIPKEDMPKFEEEEEKEEQTYSVNPMGEQSQSLITKKSADSVAYKRLAGVLVDEMQSRMLIREESPLGKFLDGVQNIYIHVVDFTSEYEYKGKKYPGIIFLHEKKTLQEIFPTPSKAFCMVGWTFGDIPVVTTEFIEIDTYKNIPIFYPTVTKDRLLMIANLGFYDEKLPSLKTVTAAKNLIELQISYQIIEYVQFLEKKFKGQEEITKKQMRKGMGIYDKALDVHKKLHTKPKEDKWWLIPALIGAALGFLIFPWVAMIVEAIIDIIT